jgi:hypothetical protein
MRAAASILVIPHTTTPMKPNAISMPCTATFAVAGGHADAPFGLVVVDSSRRGLAVIVVAGIQGHRGGAANVLFAPI